MNTKGFSTDALFKGLCRSGAALGLLLAIALAAALVWASADLWRAQGLRFLLSDDWNPAGGSFGAAGAVVGTLVTTGLALVVAVPLAFAAALFVNAAPPWLGRPLAHALDLLAAIPSVVYGMWGLFVLAPIMQDHVQPLLAAIPGSTRLLGEDYNGFGFLTTGLILSLMILPYMSAVMRDVFRMTPPMLREAAYGAGCTRWEATKDVVMRYGIRGILGGIFIGMGRALGETMAVLFVIGNMMQLPEGLFSGGTTIAATLANNFAESQGLEQSALFALGLILLLMSFGIQVAAQYYLHLTGAKRGEAR